MTDLADIAHALLAPGKGLLAADESVGTADKRLESYGITSGQGMRKYYRELFIETPGIDKYLSGVILFTETLIEEGSEAKLFPEELIARSIQPGIKVDEGTEPFPESPKELITKGLIGLPERLQEFKKRGATFTKWRAVITIEGDQLPSAQALHENAKRLAVYAKQAQEAELVPILEPEVLLDGNHSRARAAEVIKATLDVVSGVLDEQSVDKSGIILKTAMALSGSLSGKLDTPEEVAESTLDALLASVPKTVAGIVFLSGGQSPDQATANLAAITRLAQARGVPWSLTFSYARALQEEALSIWQGNPANVPLARAAFLARLEKVAQAIHI
jgi:fructose-bisphosphate aldolase, class I